MNISDNVTFETSIATQHIKIINQPNKIELECMRQVAINCYEPLLKWYKKPIKINSFFRSQELNSKVKGLKDSQHMKGQAIDFTGGNVLENKKLFNWCLGNLNFDQLINEEYYTWFHISYVKDHNRKQVINIDK